MYWQDTKQHRDTGYNYCQSVSRYNFANLLFPCSNNNVLCSKKNGFTQRTALIYKSVMEEICNGSSHHDMLVFQPITCRLLVYITYLLPRLLTLKTLN